MKAYVVVAGMLALTVVMVPAALGTGGQTTHRILAPGQTVMVGPGTACPEPYGQGSPECLLLRDMLGYNGGTAAMIRVGEGHVGHAITCSVTSSAAGAVGKLAPYPANFLLGDSIALAYDNDGDTFIDEREGGRSLEHGPTPVVSGVVKERTYVVNEGGSDVTIECTF